MNIIIILIIIIVFYLICTTPSKKENFILGNLFGGNLDKGGKGKN